MAISKSDSAEARYRREISDQYSQYPNWISQLLPSANQIIRICDQDWQMPIWESSNCHAQLASFLTADRQRKIQLLLRRVEWASANAAHLKALLRRFSTQIEVWALSGDALVVEDVFVLIDEHSMVRKPVWSHSRTVLEQGGAAIFQPWLTRWDELLQTGEVTLTATTLGLDG